MLLQNSIMFFEIIYILLMAMIFSSHKWNVVSCLFKDLSSGYLLTMNFEFNIHLLQTTTCTGMHNVKNINTCSHKYLMIFFFNKNFKIAFPTTIWITNSNYHDYLTTLYNFVHSMSWGFTIEHNSILNWKLWSILLTQQQMQKYNW